VAQHAVLVDARFVGECVGTDDGLVALHRHADQALQQLRSADDARGIDRAVLLVESLAHLQHHRDFFQRAVAGALADAVDGAFDLARAAFDGGQRVGHGQAQVVVAVRAEDHIGRVRYVGDAGDDLLEHRADFLRRGEADGVGQVDGGGAGGDGHARDLDQVVQLGTGGILGRELDIVDVGAGQRDVLAYRFQDLLAAHAQLVLAVQWAGRQEYVQARIGGGFQGPRRGLDVGLQAA
jgi:hypothetical protein